MVALLGNGKKFLITLYPAFRQAIPVPPDFAKKLDPWPHELDKMFDLVGIIFYAKYAVFCHGDGAVSPTSLKTQAPELAAKTFVELNDNDRRRVSAALAPKCLCQIQFT